MARNEATVVSTASEHLGASAQRAMFARGSVLLILVLTFTANAAGCTDKRSRKLGTTAGKQLLAYREEQGGVVARVTSLTIATNRRAVLQIERCTARFQLSERTWVRLKGAHVRAKIHDLTGDYGTTSPKAEQSTWTIASGQDSIRVRDFTFPPRLRVKLEPLLHLLDEAISTGKRRLPRACTGAAKVSMHSTARASRKI
jgi:hypothetical protein